MTTRWYRAYEGTVTDPKLGEVALVAGCSRSVAVATWHAILERCAAMDQGGQFDTTPRRIAVQLSEPLAMIEAVFAELSAMGLLDGQSVAKWKERQFESDSSTQRSRKHREMLKNVAATTSEGNATLQKRPRNVAQRSGNDPETETETDTEKEEKKEPRAARLVALASADAFNRFWTAYPHKVGKPDAARAFFKVASELEPILAGLQTYIEGKPSDRSWLNPSTFINQRRWEDLPAKTAGAQQNGRSGQGNSVSAATDALIGIFDGQPSGGGREEGQAHVRMLPAR